MVDGFKNFQQIWVIMILEKITYNLGYIYNIIGLIISIVWLISY